MGFWYDYIPSDLSGLALADTFAFQRIRAMQLVKYYGCKHMCVV